MTTFFDHLRATQFPQLEDGVVYADWTGAALPPKCLIDAHHAFLLKNLLGNPHSHHASSQNAMKAVTEARNAVLEYFNANPNEYDVIWTHNASGAILLLQHYIWKDGELLLSASNHNTVNGLREIAREAGAQTHYAPLREDLAINANVTRQHLEHPHSTKNKIFGYPAKSNYSGVEHSLEWVEIAQHNGWDVLLDAAAFLANSKLDLSAVKPEFVPASFYKIFGFPTGIGCLLIKKSVYPRLHKKWFAGGTVVFASVENNSYTLLPSGSARFEDGTINFQMIPAITEGLHWVNTLEGRREHACTLGTKLYDALSALSINNKTICLYSPRGTDIVTFNVLKNGTPVVAADVEAAASAQGIHFRSGCFCNPGDNECAMHPVAAEGRPTGAIRASFGYANTMTDIERIMNFFRGYLAAM